MKSFLFIFAVLFIEASLASDKCMDEDQCRENISGAIETAQKNWLELIETATKSEKEAEGIFSKRIIELNDSIAAGPEPCRKFLLHERPIYYIEGAYELCPPATRPDEPSDETVATVNYFADNESSIKDETNKDHYCKHITIYQNYYCHIVTVQLEALEKCDLWGILSYLHEREWDECVKAQ